LSAFIHTITGALAKGDKVTLVGFGTFERRNRKARTGRIGARKGYRTSPATLRRIARHNVYFHMDRPHAGVLGEWRIGGPSLETTRRIGLLHGADRAEAIDEARDVMARSTGARISPRDTITSEYALALCSLPDPVTSWSPAERRLLGRVIAARGAASEAEFARLQDGHARLARALRRLLAPPSRSSGARTR